MERPATGSPQAERRGGASWQSACAWHGVVGARPIRFRMPATRHACTPLQDAPKTGQHQVEEALTREALGLFFDEPDRCSTTNTSGGVNNVVSYVQTPQGDKYILRIYNNGNVVSRKWPAWLQRVLLVVTRKIAEDYKLAGQRSLSGRSACRRLCVYAFRRMCNQGIAMMPRIVLGHTEGRCQEQHRMSRCDT
eukprot:362866-Chlamydomonas_euryale.AAC.1